MLQSNQSDVKSTSPASSPNSYNPVKTTTVPVEQATIGRTLVIKGELSGAEALYIDGRVEGKITTREWTNKEGQPVKTTEIRADRVVLLGGGGERNGSTSTRRDHESSHDTRPSSTAPDDDEIPFVWLLPILLPLSAAALSAQSFIA